MNIIIKIPLSNRNPFDVINPLRLTCRVFKNSGYCASFTIVNRANEGTVDCYLFDWTQSINEIKQKIVSLQIDQINIQEFSMTPDHSLVKTAGMTIEVLLNEYRTEEIHSKLITENIHYILNGLGNDYKAEIDFYLNAIHLIVQHVMRDK